MLKHTPGPWRAQNCVGVYTERGQLVASVHTPITPHSADAYLIAAAPDLLDALRDALAAAECSSILASDYVIGRMRDAIEKATTRSL
jgi:hypothetical protein